jgi:hypothetical protein
MSVIILYFCLYGHAARCVAKWAPSSSLVCTEAQAVNVAQQWLHEHPGWEVAGWRCEIGKGA